MQKRFIDKLKLKFPKPTTHHYIFLDEASAEVPWIKELWDEGVKEGLLRVEKHDDGDSGYLTERLCKLLRKR